jgi:hypothetical protein
MCAILLIIDIAYGVCRIVINQYNNADISYFCESAFSRC